MMTSSISILLILQGIAPIPIYMYVDENKNEK